MSNGLIILIIVIAVALIPYVVAVVLRREMRLYLIVWKNAKKL